MTPRSSSKNQQTRPKASVIFTTSADRRLLLGNSRGRLRRQQRRRLDTEEWLARVRYHEAMRREQRVAPDGFEVVWLVVVLALVGLLAAIAR